MFSLFYIQTLYIDSSQIEDVHLLLCAHFMDTSFLNFGNVELRQFLRPKSLDDVLFV